MQERQNLRAYHLDAILESVELSTEVEDEMLDADLVEGTDMLDDDIGRPRDRSTIEILQRLEDVHRVAHPVGIPTNRFLSGDAFDRVHAVGDKALLLLTAELITVLPGPSVRGRFMEKPTL